jgi:UDP-glucose 4-epimerase
MRTLVTGGAGFIGSHLTDALLARGDEVTVLDDLSTGKLENLQSALANGADLAEGDILDPEFVEETLRAVRPHTVFHLAAQGNVRHSTSRPVKDAEVNVIGTLNLITSGLAIGLDRFVFTSTGGAIYGEADCLPAREDGPRKPISPYGVSKLTAERYLELHRQMYMFNSIALRLTNVYGPRQNPGGESGVVAIFGEKMREGESPVIFGDGRQTRDFVYVDDVIDAIITAANTDVEGPVNIGSGTETTLLELVAAIGDAIPRTDSVANGNQPTDLSFTAARRDEVRRNSVDTSRAAELLGWSATTPLETGLARTLGSLTSTGATFK